MKKEQTPELEAPEELTEAEFQALINSPKFAEYYRNAQTAAAPQESDVQRQTRELSEAETQEDLDRSLAWVMKVFKPMIRMKEQRKNVYFAEILSTERTRRQGLTTMGEGWTRIVSMPAGHMAVLYIRIILDGSLKTDREKIKAIVAESRAKGKEDGQYNDAWRLIARPKLELRTRYYK